MNELITSPVLKSGARKWPGAAVLAGALLMNGVPASADHSAFVTVTGHSEEALTWCGPATGQMVMGGYPTSACTLDQVDVDASIQAHKVEGNWDTDPAGLRDAMMELCPPPGGGHWVVYARTDASSLTHSEAYWMTRNHFPVAALLSTTSHNSFGPHQEHWVAIKGMVTDVDPTTNPTVTLNYVFFVDPAVPLGDPPLERFVSGGVWLSELQAVTKTPSAYNGQFVAVIEPPPTIGKVRFKQLVLVGRPIRIPEAVRAATRWVRDLKLTEMATFREFAGAQAGEPVLVNAKRGGYYIVPFAVPGKPAALAVLVNAYNGDFLEAGRFTPRKFLPERTALERLRSAFRLKDPIGPADYKAELVSTPDAATRYLPEWRITTRGRTLAVGQLGDVRELKQSGH